MTRRPAWFRSRPTFAYVAPFACLLLLTAFSSYLEWNDQWQSPAIAVIVGALLWVCWPRHLDLKLADASGGALLGLAVFLIWIAPDILWPGYRNGPALHNKLTGGLHSSLTLGAIHSGWVLFWRSFRAVLLAPIAAELFWRGWLMRRLISRDFEEIPVGSYTSLAFWLVAVLFAAFERPYWDVGLAAGILYNWWAVRSRSLADVIWMHSVANACLSAYVIGAGAWQYWR